MYYKHKTTWAGKKRASARGLLSLSLSLSFSSPRCNVIKYHCDVYR